MMNDAKPGKIILLNGASSAGKSTLARALQAHLDEPFLQFSPDFLLFHEAVLPRRHDLGGPFSWHAMRPKFFEGYLNCLPALASAGNNLVTDFVLETREQWFGLVKRLAAFDVFFVGVHVALEELERRERQRGDRRLGDARRDFEIVHSFGRYDFEVDSSHPPEENARRIIDAWRARSSVGVFARAAREIESAGT
ncbi:phosphotransferase-like protein [Deinococcus yavapaiensis]|uniref:Chloramphenicol 3-O phosphotransferase n=1 Tax=Deinococcus yavapaiensis KR-236 TaxID=694435 RepID=A0A318S9L3_9DEIO|nr:chloramphenicol phosphotransferase [Deinococcus yavapaiensis]PYE53153.1 chloramphenicol 3-O phosphotransferase [Deinococcus yavapaiensis KR-236]